MKQFSIYIIKRLLLVTILVWILDMSFTLIYTKSDTLRNKVDYIFLNKQSQVDYIFLGSSRVEYHINTDMIDDETATKSLNLGISGQNLSETFLMLKLLVANEVSAKTYFIQIDESGLLKESKKSFIGASYFMPYMNQSVIQEHVKQYNADYWQDYYIPFYRYMNYGHKIGYRELALRILGSEKKTNFYLELQDTIRDKNASYQMQGSYDSTLINEIKNFAASHNLEVVFYTAPYLNATNDADFEMFCQQHQIKNYTHFITSPDKFKDLDHLNKFGSREFTQRFMEDFIQKKSLP